MSRVLSDPIRSADDRIVEIMLAFMPLIRGLYRVHHWSVLLFEPQVRKLERGVAARQLTRGGDQQLPVQNDSPETKAEFVTRLDVVLVEPLVVDREPLCEHRTGIQDFCPL